MNSLRRADGFTLIELLVALAVVALCVGVAYPGLSGAIRRVTRDRDSAGGTLVAQSVLERVGRDIQVGSGHAAGSDADGYAWRVDIVPYDGALVPASGALRAYLVRVTVGWNERGQPRQTGLTTLRLARRRPSS